MGTLEKVIELKKKGVSEKEIISQLKEQGINPMEINDSIEQEKIKQAVGEEKPAQNMEPSIMSSEENQAPSPLKNPPQQTQNQEYAPQQNQEYAPQAYSPEANYDANYAPQETYPENQTYQEDTYSSGGMNTETIIEIAEQVFTEKMKNFEKELGNLKEFKTIYKSKIEDIDARTKRIEKMFDKMQLSILEKVGNFSKNINSIQKEVKMVEDSLGKIIKKK